MAALALVDVGPEPALLDERAADQPAAVGGGDHGVGAVGVDPARGPQPGRLTVLGERGREQVVGAGRLGGGVALLAGDVELVEEVADREHPAVPGDRDRVDDVVAAGAEGLDPARLAVGRDRDDERVGAARALARAELAERALGVEVAADCELAAAERDCAGGVAGVAAEALGPADLAGRATGVGGEGDRRQRRGRRVGGRPRVGRARSRSCPISGRRGRLVLALAGRGAGDGDGDGGGGEGARGDHGDDDGTRTGAVQRGPARRAPARRRWEPGGGARCLRAARGRARVQSGHGNQTRGRGGRCGARRGLPPAGAAAPAGAAGPGRAD